MPCYKPLKAYKCLNRFTENGKHHIILGVEGEGNEEHMPIEIACGQCIGCRISSSREWALRICHEGANVPCTAIALTYNDENLPYRATLTRGEKSDFTLFMKRLRKSLEPKKIRFFQCGEYGDIDQRPHHHAILFNHEFPDKEFLKTKDGNPVYYSKTLEKIWGKGFCSISDFCFETAAYIARYCVKKVTGDRAAEHYVRYDTETDEMYYLEPEYITMSTHPGIGRDWHKRFSGDTHKNFLTHRGKKCKVPRYYDRLLEASDPEMLKLMKLDRARRVLEGDPNERTLDRRVVTEEVIKRNYNKSMKRGIS